METLPLLPFAWAKREQLLLLPLFDDNQWRMILCTDKTSSAALAEARRVAGQTLTLRRVSDSEFEQQLVACYQRDSAETRQLMEDIGNDMDLFTLIDELPDSDDLLSEDDDAPIIRLINAMIMEAIKTQASDIHIETYEQRVQIRFRIDGVPGGAAADLALKGDGAAGYRGKTGSAGWSYCCTARGKNGRSACLYAALQPR